MYTKFEDYDEIISTNTNKSNKKKIMKTRNGGKVLDSITEDY